MNCHTGNVHQTEMLQCIKCSADILTYKRGNETLCTDFTCAVAAVHMLQPGQRQRFPEVNNGLSLRRLLNICG